MKRLPWIGIVFDSLLVKQVIAAGSLNEGVRRSVPKWRALRDSNPPTLGFEARYSIQLS